MTTPSYPTVWYWVVQDTNPTTQVWEASSGSFVANNAANYLSWVANGGTSITNTGPGSGQVAVTGAADNGAGLIRLTVPSTNGMVTNDRWVVQLVGGTTEANGRWPLTVIDATHVDLQGSTFTHAFTSNGVIDRGSVIDTAANLYALINTYNLNLYNAKGPNVTFNHAFGADITLTLPLASITNYDFTSTGHKLILPSSQSFGSAPIGVPFWVVNTGIYEINLSMPNGALLALLYGGTAVQIVMYRNSSNLGSDWEVISPGVGAYVLVPTADAQIPISTAGFADSGYYAGQTVSGDATITNAGVVTVTKVKGNNPIAVADGGTGAAKYNACRIYLNANQTGIASATATRINFDTVDFDADSIADVVTNHRITPNVAGTYKVTCGIDCSGSWAAAGFWTIHLRKNGAEPGVGNTYIQNPGAAASIDNALQTSVMVQMNGSTDYIDASITIDLSAGTATSLGLKRTTYLELVRVAP